MKFIRIILFPLVPIYYVVTWLRNWFYNKGIFSSQAYDFPVICVGNLSTGGTGKTPMIEYLIRLLKDEKLIATLSRGYKRTTNGFVLADKNANALTIGDEPFQFYSKFKDIVVAVDGDRQNGIAQLTQLKEKPDLVLLDDAFQHRKVKPGFNILLTSFDKPYFEDIVLPTGNLREPRSGANRADILVITKCPQNLSEAKKQSIKEKIKPQPNQDVFFSEIIYSDVIISTAEELSLKSLPKFTLVTGIANAQPLVNYLVGLGLKFDHVEYPDHYSFKQFDINKLDKNDLILTTEKDFVRLSVYKELESKLYYLPIKIKLDNEQLFNEKVRAFVN